jgi:hypothetical protein
VKTLVLHIGANKTGSSAIQAFLRLNAAELARSGLFVAPSDLSLDGEISGQHVWFVEELLSDIPAGGRRIARRIDKLMAGLPEDARLLISAENLSNGTGAERVFGGLAETYDVQVLFYVRRQDELLLSSWQQWESKISGDFWAWLTDCVGIRGNWRSVLQAWENVVPRNNITVRIYERSRMPDGDVIADFARALGLSERLSELQRPEGVVNASYADAVVELAKGNRALFHDKHDNDFYNAVEQLTEGRYHRNPRESVITHEQRRAILRRYVESNEWVRAHYFPDLPELFVRPKPADYIVLDGDGIEARKWELAASLIFGIAKRVLR